MKATKNEVMETVVTLTMNYIEAQFLHDLLDRVGGDPYHTRRAIGQKMSAVLNDIGVHGSVPTDMLGTITIR